MELPPFHSYNNLEPQQYHFYLGKSPAQDTTINSPEKEQKRKINPKKKEQKRSKKRPYLPHLVPVSRLRLGPISADEIPYFSLVMVPQLKEGNGSRSHYLCVPLRFWRDPKTNLEHEIQIMCDINKMVQNMVSE